MKDKVMYLRWFTILSLLVLAVSAHPQDMGLRSCPSEVINGCQRFGDFNARLCIRLMCSPIPNNANKAAQMEDKSNKRAFFLPNLRSVDQSNDVRDETEAQQNDFETNNDDRQSYDAKGIRKLISPILRTIFGDSGKSDTDRDVSADVNNDVASKSQRGWRRGLSNLLTGDDTNFDYDVNTDDDMLFDYDMDFDVMMHDYRK